MRVQSGTVRTVWVVILVLPVVTGALFVASGALGLVARMFGH
ncbi:hypothetical protein [Paraburkholderia hospita]|nr:hypothetical protein [Paraburkholderia hospita]